jgi:cytoskeletal protein CcmA (bactofilin family)
MVFRRDTKVDAFQRQMSALRHQIGGDAGEGSEEYDAEGVDERLDRTQGDTMSQPPYDRGENSGYSFGNYPGQQPDQPDYGDPRGMQPTEMAEVDSQVSVVAQGTIFKGEIQSDGNIQVFGRAEGTLTAKEDIWIAEGADVEATLSARRIIVAGRVNGHIKASNRFEALPQGVVEADVTAPSFVVHEGATINGALSMQQQEVTSGRQERAGSTTAMPRRNRG